MLMSMTTAKSPLLENSVIGLTSVRPVGPNCLQVTNPVAITVYSWPSSPTQARYHGHRWPVTSSHRTAHTEKAWESITMAKLLLVDDSIT